MKPLCVWYFVFVLKWEMLFYGDVFNHRYLPKLLHTFKRNRPMLYTRHIIHAYFCPLQHSLAIIPFDRFSSKIKIRHFNVVTSLLSVYILESSDRNGKFFCPLRVSAEHLWIPLNWFHFKIQEKWIKTIEWKRYKKLVFNKKYFLYNLINETK